MFNKNFFLGVLTTLAVVTILAVGGLAIRHAFLPAAGVVIDGQSGRFEQHFGRQFQPGDRDRDGGRFEGRPDRAFPGGDRRTGFFLRRGLAGVLGSLLLIGLIVAAVVGGSKLFKRLSRRSTPAPAVELVEPEPPVEPTAEPEPLAEPAAEPEPPAEPVAESEPEAEPADQSGPAESGDGEPEPAS